MKVHRRVPYTPMHALTVTAEGLSGTPRSESLGRAGRGIIILAFALGSIGAEAAAVSAHGDLASAAQPAGSIRLGANMSPISSQHITQRPWMY
jgi:hypothetical protein